VRGEEERTRRLHAELQRGYSTVEAEIQQRPLEEVIYGWQRALYCFIVLIYGWQRIDIRLAEHCIDIRLAASIVLFLYRAVEETVPRSNQISSSMHVQLAPQREVKVLGK